MPQTPFVDVADANAARQAVPGALAALQHALLRGIAAALNHLLARDDAAARRLCAHAGRRVALRVGRVDAVFEAAQPGRLIAVAAPAPASDLRLDVDAAAVLASQMRGQQLGLSGVRIAGDAEFAQTVSWLLGHLRWDAEDDLAGLIGDVAAHRAARGARGLRDEGLRLARRFEGDARDWLAEAPRPVVARPEFDAVRAEVARLRDRVARLDKRIALLRQPVRS